MRKDYISVSGSDEQMNEASFVEQYWTGIWEKGAGDEAWNRDIERREEFGLMKPFLDQLPAGARILDGGCGTGAWTLCLGRLGYEVVGLDISRATIEKLKTLFPNKNFEEGDIRSTRFPDGSFDAYFSWGAFEHFEIGLGPCMSEARRIVKPGGYLFVSVPFHNERMWKRDHQPLAAVDSDYESGAGYRHAQRFYQWRLTKQELQREFEMYGFNTLQINAIHKSSGIHRMIVTDFGFAPQSPAHYVLSRVLGPLVGKDYVSHMIMAVGRKW